MSSVTAAIVVGGSMIRNSIVNNQPNQNGGPANTARLTEVSDNAAKTGDELGTGLTAEAKRQYDENSIVGNRVSEAQLKAMDENNARGKDYYEYMKQMQRPLQARINEQALGPDTSAASAGEMGLISGSNADVQNSRYGSQIAEQAATAGVDQMSGYSRALAIAARQGARYGYSPEKIAAQAAAQSSTQASSVASATNTARNSATDQARGLVAAKRSMRIQDETTGFGRRMDASKMYDSGAENSARAYGLGITAGNSALGNKMVPGESYLKGMKAGADTTLTGRGLQIQGHGAAVAGQNAAYANRDKDPGLPIGAIITAAAAAI